MSEAVSPVNSQQAAYELLTRRAARSNLLDFTKHTFPAYVVNWHHQVLCETLDRFVSGEIKRLMVFLPPRNGKSELVSRRLPAYIFGQYPDKSIISCSYSADLAARMNRDVQRIIDSPQYRSLFPEVTLNGKNTRTMADGSYLRNSDLFEIVNHRGVYRSAGVGGGITGMGMDIGIIDDPIKNIEEALSQTYREKVKEWYTSTFYTRLEKDAQILITLTRWHEDDLAGWLLDMVKQGGEDWYLISFPAIAEEPLPDYDPRLPGDPLWPDKYSLERLQAIKSVVGSYQWQSLYQQRPTSQEGGLFKRTWWKFYKQAPRCEEVIQSWDCAFKDSSSSDYVVGQVWGRLGADKYLLDQIRARLDLPATIQAIKTLSAKWSMSYAKLIEDKANGPAVIQSLKSEIPGLIPVEPEGGKVVRAHATSPDVQAGNVYLPDPTIAPWIHDYIEEFASFPRGKNDDQVDGTTQAIIWFNSHAKSSDEPLLEEALGYEADIPDFGYEGEIPGL